MGTTPNGIPYPEPTDTLATYPATAKAAAEKVPHIQAGATNVTVASGSNTGTVSVTFPRAFARVPQVVVAALGSGSWIPFVLTTPTATAVTIGVRQFQNLTTGATVNMPWVATDPAGSV